MESLVRHTLATLAYRLGKVLRGAPEEFGSYQERPSSRTPVQILAHIGDLMEWALSMTEGRPGFRGTQALAWPQEVDRFFQSIQALDASIAAHGLEQSKAEGLIQGPIADALTHTGQLAMLRRMAGWPVKGENYFVAEIVAGRLGPDQAPPRKEF